MTTAPRIEPRIEIATPDDLEALVALRQSQGWTPHTALLSAVLATTITHTGLVRAGSIDPTAPNPRQPVATTSALAAGPVGVIGNVIVSDDYRRRGLARALMVDALTWQRERGAAISLLDATAAGRPLYLSLGYASVGEYSWFARARLDEVNRGVLRDRAEGLTARQVPSDAVERVAALDLAAFGGDRMSLLRGVLAQPDTWLYLVDDASGGALAYAFVRLMEHPRPGIHVGPLIARTPAGAAAVFEAITARDAAWRAAFPHTTPSEVSLLLSTPHLPDAAFALFAQCGFHMERDDLLMRLNVRPEAVGAGIVAWSIAEHPEWVWSWLAPMAF